MDHNPQHDAEDASAAENSHVPWPPHHSPERFPCILCVRHRCTGRCWACNAPMCSECFREHITLVHGREYQVDEDAEPGDQPRRIVTLV